MSLILAVGLCTSLLAGCGGKAISVDEDKSEETGKAKAIRFSTLDAICKALECQPADIIEYTDNES